MTEAAPKSLTEQIIFIDDEIHAVMAQILTCRSLGPDKRIAVTTVAHEWLLVLETTRGHLLKNLRHQDLFKSLEG